MMRRCLPARSFRQCGSVVVPMHREEKKAPACQFSLVSRGTLQCPPASVPLPYIRNERFYGWVKRPAMTDVPVHRREAIQPRDIWIVAHMGDQRIFGRVVARPYPDEPSLCAIHFCVPASDMQPNGSLSLSVVTKLDFLSVDSDGRRGHRTDGRGQARVALSKPTWRGHNPRKHICHMSYLYRPCHAPLMALFGRCVTLWSLLP